METVESCVNARSYSQELPKLQNHARISPPIYPGDNMGNVSPVLQAPSISRIPEGSVDNAWVPNKFLKPKLHSLLAPVAEPTQ